MWDDGGGGARLGAGRGEIPAAGAGMTEFAHAGMTDLCARVWRILLARVWRERGGMAGAVVQGLVLGAARYPRQARV